MLFLGIILWSTSAFSSTPPLWVSKDSPSMMQSLHTSQSSYLTDFETGRFASSTPINDYLFDSGMVLRMRNDYRNMTKDYEMRHQYELTTLQDERDQTNRMSDFARHVVHSAKAAVIQKNMKIVRKNAEATELYSLVKRPMGFIIGAVAVYSGEPVTWKVDEVTEFVATTDFKNKRGEFRLASPIVRGSFNVLTAVPVSADDQLKQDPNRSVVDKYSLSLGRPLPIWQLSSGLSYGMTTTKMTASLSKQLTEHLACIVDTSKLMRPIARVDPGQQSLRLEYGFNF